MSDPFQAVLILAGAVFAIGCCTAGMMFAACLVCRWMNWAPVNLTINLNDYRDNQ